MDFKYALLPSFMRFTSARDLIRVGKKNDGGYLVSKNDIEISDYLISLGLNDDWSFEQNFCAINDVPVIAYDGSVSENFFFRQMIYRLWRIDKPKKLVKSINTYFSYRSFFKGSHRHIKKFVGLDFDKKHCKIDGVFKGTRSNNIFLKIDIESSEYRILDELIANEDRFTGVVIEFHDCDIHLERIRSFVDKFSLKIVHIHANNFAPIEAETSLPIVLEVTFSRDAVLDDTTTLPHPFDMPNRRNQYEIALDFEPNNSEMERKFG